ncbi:Uncharacterised protein [Escherichia coli]|nr:Uncharacterised protein [Escherichia coli]SQN95124.1 Uncharacterised protein [Escherichia coli]SQT45036.1 Uncharacterised protein [Escherichia coli]SQT56589.1 Uncharacterised protein [Escherichia coli]SQT63392.1 Uncharacterised protein [Escherichia coli]
MWKERSLLALFLNSFLKALSRQTALIFQLIKLLT